VYRIIFLRAVAAIAGGMIANRKGRGMLAWSVLCFIFPPLILLILILQPKLARGKTRTCPYCSRVIYKEDTVCRYCKRELPIELVQCKACGNFVPDKDYCLQCNRKLKV